MKLANKKENEMKKLTAEIKEAMKTDAGVFYNGNKIESVRHSDGQCFVMVKGCDVEIRVICGGEIRFGSGMDARRGTVRNNLFSQNVKRFCEGCGNSMGEMTDAAWVDSGKLCDECQPADDLVDGENFGW